MDLELAGRVAVVTGGSVGIGKAVARELAREGADVALVSRMREAADVAAAELSTESGCVVIAALADTGDDEAVRRMVAEVLARFGRIDILVNCAAEPAGQAVVPRTIATTRERLEAHMNVKVMGYLRCAREVIPHMTTRGWGRIINISGVGARKAGDAVGSIRNAAVVALSKNLADDLGPTGISVNVVHPGLTRTEKVQTRIAALAQAEGVSEREMEGRMASNLLGRLPTAEEVAYVVAFLASPKAVAISGEVIVAAGGVRQIITY